MKIKGIRKIKKYLSGVEKVVVTDYSSYDERQCRTGGSYSYTTVYERIKHNGKWEIQHFTSAEVGHYCRDCGSFHNWDYNCGGPEIIDTVTVFNRIKRRFENDDYKIRFE